MGLLHALLTQGPSMRFFSCGFFHALGDLNTWRGRTTGGSGSSASEPKLIRKGRFDHENKGLTMEKMVAPWDVIMIFSEVNRLWDNSGIHIYNYNSYYKIIFPQKMDSEIGYVGMPVCPFNEDAIQFPKSCRNGLWHWCQHSTVN